MKGFDPRITPARPDLAARHLAGKVAAERFVDGMLREVGDIAHLTALCLPRRVVFAGGVFGDGRKLLAEELRKTFEPAAQVGKLLKADAALQLMGSDDTDRIIKALP